MTKIFKRTVMTNTGDPLCYSIQIGFDPEQPVVWNEKMLAPLKTIKVDFAPETIEDAKIFGFEEDLVKFTGLSIMEFFKTLQKEE